MNIFNKLFKEEECKHKWKIVEYSNVLQVDDMGYPSRLVICKCSKCGATDQQWRDVPKESLNQLDTGESVLLQWTRI